MATAAKSAHADGIYINATTPTLAKNQILPPRHASRRLLTPATPTARCPAATLRGTSLCGVLSTASPLDQGRRLIIGWTAHL